MHMQLRQLMRAETTALTVELPVRMNARPGTVA